ncbi:MAG: VIT1/CCC1 family protein [Firmicutes bacterium]|nr:VIT1/CCC1 family protein [Bacillota bacterium]
MEKVLSPKTLETVKMMQEGEVTESAIYASIAKNCKDPNNKKILEQISADEMRHANLWKHYTGVEVKPNKRKIRHYAFLNRLFGFTFTIRLMENGENKAQKVYDSITGEIPEAQAVEHEEKLHEESVIAMLDEERLQFVGAIVLGLNDALVELTGALAGFTMAYGDQIKLIALSGLITGLAAALSMAASAYLQASANDDKNAKKSSIYTGLTYLFTVALLIAPYLVFGFLNVPNGKWFALGIMLTTVILIIAGFNYYISVAKQYSFKKRFFSMLMISMGVAGLSFLLGLLVKTVFHISI